MRSERKHYRVRGGLIPGGKIGPEFKDHTLIAVPEHIVHPGLICVYGEDKMLIPSRPAKIGKEFYADKFGSGRTYRLMYYPWKPQFEKQLSMF